MATPPSRDTSGFTLQRCRDCTQYGQDSHGQEAKGFVAAYENDLKQKGGYPKRTAADGR